MKTSARTRIRIRIWSKSHETGRSDAEDPDSDDNRPSISGANEGVEENAGRKPPRLQEGLAELSPLVRRGNRMDAAGAIAEILDERRVRILRETDLVMTTIENIKY